MKKVLTICKTLTASLFIASGLLAAVVAEPADAIRVRRRGFSTDAGSFDVDYEIDYTSVDDQGIPDAGTVTSLDITLGEVIFDANFQSFGFDVPRIPLLAPQPSTSISFGSNSLEFDNGCSLETFCNSTDDLQLNVDLISDSLEPTAPELIDGLLETQYTISFSGEFSDEVPIDPNGVKGITPAQKEEGVDGILDIFFSQPDETEDLIYSFGSIRYTSTLPGFISANLGGDEVAFVDPFAPFPPIDDREPTDVPEPGMAVSLLALGAAYGVGRRVKRSHKSFAQQRSV